MLYTIIEKKSYHPLVTGLTVHAPLVAQAAQPGQFVMLRVCEQGERIPLTLSDYDREKGTVSLLFQKVGLTTTLLGAMEPGDALPTLVGPLGHPTRLDGVRRACVVGGGLGCAIAYPIAAALHRQGAYVDVIAGFRTGSLVFLEEELRAVSDTLTVCTDDGSYGRAGLVTAPLADFLNAQSGYDLVMAIGPLPMMKFVSLTTKPFGIKTIVSLNSLMVDGTGMCGCCRITVDGQVRFACVDGPDFDGHGVDYDEALRRSGYYREQEVAALREHLCQCERGGTQDA